MYLVEDIFNDFESISDSIPDVETEILSDSEIRPEGPELGEATAISNIIHDLIISENATIQEYNNAAANMEDYPELQKTMHDIASEEYIHIGELQKALEVLSPNASNIEEGEVESEENLAESESPAEETMEEDYDPKLFKCKNCGTDFYLENQYMGACDCPGCGQWYNLFGQRLKDPKYWFDDEN